MKIRMLVEMSGARNGQPWPRRGEVADLPTAEAAHLCAAGVAEKADDAPEKAVPAPAETTTVPEAETTVQPPAEKRGPGRPRKPRDAKGNIARG